MNETIKEVVRVLELGRPELQVAAAQILGELMPRDAAVAKALETQLERGDERILGRFILEALRKIGTPEAVRVLVGRLHFGDHLSDQVSLMLADMGGAAHKALADAFDDAPAELKARILDIFGRHSSRDAVRVLQKALLTPEFSERAGAALAAQVEHLEEKVCKDLKTALIKELGGAELEVPVAALPQVFEAIARLDPTGCRPTLLKFAGDKFPDGVRRAALKAMTGVPLTPAQVKQLLAVLTDPGQKPLHGVVVTVLGAVESWPDGVLPTLKKLLLSKVPTLRLFALRSMRGFHTAEVAKISLRYLHHQDPAYRDAAVLALSENTKAVEGLLRALALEKDIDEARVTAGILAQLGDHSAKKHMKSLVEKTCKLLTADDPLGEVYFGMLMEIDGVDAADQIVDKATRLRRARRLSEALTLLARTAQTDCISDEGRYQLAVARLLLDGEGTLQETSQPGDATMGYIGTLVRANFAVRDRLVRENMIKPQSLLRVGAHFAESVGAERRFGAALLEYLGDRHQRDRIGEQARMLLRAEGLQT